MEANADVRLAGGLRDRDRSLGRAPAEAFCVATVFQLWPSFVLTSIVVVSW